MTLSAEATDSQRVRVTLGMALVGLALLLAAALLVYLGRSPEASIPADAAEVVAEHRLEEARTLTAVLLVAGLLFLLFLVTGYAFVRASRTYRRHLSAKPAKPTANRSVWEMHKPPPEPAAPTEPTPPSAPPEPPPDTPPANE